MAPTPVHYYMFNGMCLYGAFLDQELLYYRFASTNRWHWLLHLSSFHPLSANSSHFKTFSLPSTWFSPSLPLSSLSSLFRCNVQDYIWHKGARCESVVTEFQVMCLAVGASALVVLLLFMIVVCFAKKLHVLKTENKKLRKRRWGRISNNEFKEPKVLRFLLIPLQNGWCKLLKCIKKSGYLVF